MIFFVSAHGKVVLSAIASSDVSTEASLLAYTKITVTAKLQTRPAQVSNAFFVVTHGS